MITDLLLTFTATPLLWKVVYLLLAILVLWVVLFAIEKMFAPIPNEVKMILAIIVLIVAVIVLFLGGA